MLDLANINLPNPGETVIENITRMTTVESDRWEAHLENLRQQLTSIENQIQGAKDNSLPDDIIGVLETQKTAVNKDIEIYASKIAGTYVEAIEETPVDPDIEGDNNGQ